MSNDTRIEFRAFDVNDKVCGYGETAQEALANMATTIGATIHDGNAGLRNAQAARAEFEPVVDAILARAGFPVRVPGEAA